MSAPSTLIKLPEARALQLRAIADVNGCTVTEAVELLINREIKAGRLADTLHGFEITNANGHTWFVIGEIGLPPLVPAHTRLVAALFVNAADGSRDSAKGLSLGHDDFELLISRKGRGVIVTARDVTHDRESKVSMTPGMARDLARQLNKAADTIQNRT